MTTTEPLTEREQQALVEECRKQREAALRYADVT
jgi:hypothetical protein